MDTKNVFFGIDDYMAAFAPYIKRSEARELAQCYVVGLMMDGDRKSVEPMSEKVHSSERGMQRLLTEDIHHREKWRMALDLVDQAREDGAAHRAAVADSWHGNITEFRQGLDICPYLSSHANIAFMLPVAMAILVSAAP